MAGKCCIESESAKDQPSKLWRHGHVASYLSLQVFLSVKVLVSVPMVSGSVAQESVC